MKFKNQNLGASVMAQQLKVLSALQGDPGLVSHSLMVAVLIAQAEGLHPPQHYGRTAVLVISVLGKQEQVGSWAL